MAADLAFKVSLRPQESTAACLKRVHALPSSLVTKAGAGVCVIRNDGGRFITDVQDYVPAVTLLNCLKTHRSHNALSVDVPALQEDGTVVPAAARAVSEASNAASNAAAKDDGRTDPPPLSPSRLPGWRMQERCGRRPDVGKRPGTGSTKPVSEAGGGAAAKLLRPASAPIRAYLSEESSDDDTDFVHVDLKPVRNAELALQLSKIAVADSWELTKAAGPGSPLMRRESHAEFTASVKPPVSVGEATAVIATLCTELRTVRENSKRKLQVKNEKYAELMKENGRVVQMLRTLQARRGETEKMAKRYDEKIKALQEEFARERQLLTTGQATLRRLHDDTETRRATLEELLEKETSTQRVLGEKINILKKESEKKSEHLDDLERLRSIQQAQLHRKIVELEGMHDVNKTMFDERHRQMNENEGCMKKMAFERAAALRAVAALRLQLRRVEALEMARVDVDAAYAYCLAAVRAASVSPTQPPRSERPPAVTSSKAIRDAFSPQRRKSLGKMQEVVRATVRMQPQAAALNLPPVGDGVAALGEGTPAKQVVSSLAGAFKATVNGGYEKFTALWGTLQTLTEGERQPKVVEELTRMLRETLNDFAALVDSQQRSLQKRVPRLVNDLMAGVQAGGRATAAPLELAFAEALKRIAEDGKLAVDMVGFSPPQELDSDSLASVENFLSRLGVLGGGGGGGGAGGRNSASFSSLGHLRDVPVHSPLTSSFRAQPGQLRRQPSQRRVSIATGGPRRTPGAGLGTPALQRGTDLELSSGFLNTGVDFADSAADVTGGAGDGSPAQPLASYTAFGGSVPSTPKRGEASDRPASPYVLSTDSVGGEGSPLLVARGSFSIRSTKEEEAGSLQLSGTGAVAELRKPSRRLSHVPSGAGRQGLSKNASMRRPTRHRSVANITRKRESGGATVATSTVSGLQSPKNKGRRGTAITGELRRGLSTQVLKPPGK